MAKGDRLVLLTGSTGYVGGRLLNQLESRCVPLRCLARRPEYLRERVAAGTDVIGGDVLDAASLEGAFEGVNSAYYLVHSMGSAGLSRRKTVPAHGTSPRRPGKQGSDASSTWEGWVIRASRSPPTCEVVTKSATYSVPAECRSSSFAPRSYLAREVSRSR